MEINILKNNDLSKITLSNFCETLIDLKEEKKEGEFKKVYTYEVLAKACYCSTRQLKRYRDNNQGNKITHDGYTNLFKLLDDYCLPRQLSPVDILVYGFDLPDHYKKFSYDDIKKDIINVLRNRISYTPQNNQEVFHDTKHFINSRLNSDKKIKTICMGYYTGWDWLKDREKKDLLDKFKNLGIELRIIVNHRIVIEEISKSMTNPHDEKHYFGINRGIIQWNNLCSAFPNLDLRISNLPLLRKICILEYEDGSCEALFRNYIYTLYTDSDMEHTLIGNDNEWLKIYKREFEYLWNKGMKYADWNATYNATVEEVKSPNNDYIIIHFKTKKTYGISSLHLNSKHQAHLDFHLTDNLSSSLNDMKPDCTYYGSSKVMENRLFISLTNSQGFDPLCIQLINPLTKSELCYLGIMTKLNYRSPSAYKCIVIQKEIFDTFDKNQINNLITEYTKLSKQNTISTDIKESEFLYNSNFFN